MSIPRSCGPALRHQEVASVRQKPWVQITFMTARVIQRGYGDGSAAIF